MTKPTQKLKMFECGQCNKKVKSLFTRCMKCEKRWTRYTFKQGHEQALKEVEAIIYKSKHTMFSNLINRDDLKQKIQELKEKT